MNVIHNHLTISSSILDRAPDLIVATRVVSGVKVGETSVALQKEKNAILEKWKGKNRSDLESIPIIRSYRALHAKLQPRDDGFIPAVEGMLTRGILKGKFPNINSAVDSGNVVSLTYLVPIGLFDAEHIHGIPVLDLSRRNDTIYPIGKESPMAIPEGTPVLRDDEKVLSLIGVRDSKDTMVRPETSAILVFSWALGEDQRPLLDRALEECEAHLLRPLEPSNL